MRFPNNSQLRADAAAAVRCTPEQKKLVLVWAGTSVAISLLVSVVNFLLEGQISGTGGLAGIGLRSILSTAQSVLSIASAILIPFWDLGYIGSVLRISRGQSTSLSSLLAGFRRVGPSLRLILLRSFIYVGLAFVSFYFGAAVLSLTPLANPVYQVMETHQEALLSGVIDDAVAAAMIKAMVPLLIGCVAVYGIVLIPVFYKLRLAEYRLMDDPRCGALAAMLESRFLMRGQRLRLFRLDLGFWWFYLAHLAVIGLCYGDLLLPALGITHPFSGTTAFFGFYIAALVAQFLLLYFFSNRIHVTYAMFYDSLKQMSQPQDAPASDEESTAQD